MKPPDSEATFLEASPDPIVILTDEEIAYANDRANDLIGLDPDDTLRGRNVLDLVVPEEREDVRSTLQRVRTEGAQTNQRHHRIRTVDGEMRHIHATGRRITWDDQPAVLVIVHDITQQITRESQLTALHERTRAFLEATTPSEVAEQAISTVRDILDYGYASVHRYDATADALVPVAATEGLSDAIDTSPRFERGEGIAWRVFEAGEPTLIPDTRADPDVYNPSTEFRTELYVPLGDYGLFIVAVRDADGIPDAERQLLELLAANTEVAIKEVTYRQRLEDREATLEAQNERLEDFASIVSHDLRNPLNTATGYVDLIRETRDFEHLDRIEDALERMDSIIRDVRVLARRTDEPTDLDAVSLTSAVEAAWNTVCSPTEEASLTIRGDLGTIHADESHLRQLLENLFRNALEHAGDDVTVAVAPLADGFAVCDDGPGIPPEDRDSIFDSPLHAFEISSDLSYSVHYR